MTLLDQNNYYQVNAHELAGDIMPSSTTKTIDNLGMDTYVRYALDQEFLDKELVKDSRYVPSQTEVDVSSPFYSSEFEHMFETTRRNRGWAEFYNPPGYGTTKRAIFTFQILPELGSEEMFQLQSTKIREKVERDRKKNKDKQDQRKKNGQPVDFEDDLELQQEEKESQTLISLMENICVLDKILLEINSRRNQFQKG
ncbi:MAG: hypothetical protein S4CHLAM37_02320 [Chlamydiia bacterium]|nr:hypothetical protein [Chlamydiia bacterium]